MDKKSLGRIGRNARDENRKMTEQELATLRQVRAWIDRLELQGQTMGDNECFTLSAKFWVVFAGVAKLHGLKTQQVLDLTAEK